MKVEVKSILLKQQAQEFVAGFAIYAEAFALPADVAESVSSGVTALETAEADHLAQKQGLRQKSGLRSQAILAMKQFVNSATQVLKPRFGNAFNGSWLAAGVTSGSIETPSKVEELIARGSAFQAYFTANPTHEFASVNVTAVQAGNVLRGFETANAGYHHALALTRNSSDAVALANRQLQKCVRAAINTLATKMAEDDNRWVAFGLVRPVDTKIPAVPEGLAVTQSGSGTVMATWTRAVRARRYRVFVQKPGDPSPVATATVVDPMAEITGLPVGVPIKFTLVAANSSGESQPGEPVEIVLR